MIFAIALLVNFLAQACAWTVPPPTFSSEITFYNLGSEGQAGNCAYESISPVGASSYKQLPFANGVQTFVALNSEQYDGTSTCGQCLIYQGIGGGSGTTPVPKTPQYGMVTDQCPECKKGDLDLNRPGDGRWQGKWTPVECAVGGGKFQYAFEGSNDFYLKIRVLNARVPTATMTAEVGGIYQTMTPTQDNSFLLSQGGPFTFPLQVQLTSIQGDVVDDTIAKGPTGSVQGNAQYPPTPGFDQVSGDAAAVQSGTLGQVQVCNVTLEPFSQCGGENLGVGDMQIPGSCCPDGFSCVRQQQFYWQCLSDNTTAPAPGSGMEIPTTAPAAQEAPTLPPLPQSGVLCQLVQDLLDVPNLASTCGWSI